ncbi:MAG: RNA polymerase Rpb6 [Flavobacteriales bacterium]|nr:RNA polymerase Rpb6 [Flavobacteriales bacterium]|tara:strand:+ start:200 stop:634 length:435 start_codon:yes stop_codon:yes gene_type:complete
MDYKKTNAARTTISRDLKELADSVGGNMYELISILQSRANQIGVEIKEELIAKLDEFATPSDTLEEVFENQEQTEISRFYERLPKPTLIAIQELLEDNIYVREKIKKEEITLEKDEMDDLESEEISSEDVPSEENKDSESVNEV